MRHWVLVLIALVTLSGCKTTSKVQKEIVTEVVEVHDTIRDLRVVTVLDSLILHDSIVVTKTEQGEVKYVERYVDRDRWHYGETKVVHDSIVVYRDMKSDTKETEKVVTKNKWYDGLIAFAFLFAIGFGIIYGIKKLI